LWLLLIVVAAVAVVLTLPIRADKTQKPHSETKGKASRPCFRNAGRGFGVWGYNLVRKRLMERNLSTIKA